VPTKSFQFVSGTLMSNLGRSRPPITNSTPHRPCSATALENHASHHDFPVTHRGFPYTSCHFVRKLSSRLHKCGQDTPSSVPYHQHRSSSVTMVPHQKRLSATVLSTFCLPVSDGSDGQRCWRLLRCCRHPWCWSGGSGVTKPSVIRW